VIPDRVKREAGRAWDRVRADAEKLEKAKPGAGEGYLLGAAAALDAYREQRLSGLSGFPVGSPR
jgi:hypothetical protein